MRITLVMRATINLEHAKTILLYEALAHRFRNSPICR